jgi:hypothetical protein
MIFLERNPRLANWIYGFRPPERGTIILVHRRVYILPARLGLLFGATLAILLGDTHKDPVVEQLDLKLGAGFTGADIDVEVANMHRAHSVFR